MTRVYPSKRDRWLAFVIWISVAFVVSAASGLALSSRPGTAGILLVSAAGMLWMFYGTHYTVRDDELIIRSGPLRWRIPLRSIIAIEPSTDPIASPACSLDRLEIRYAEGSRRVLVSPVDKDGFLGALQSEGRDRSLETQSAATSVFPNPIN